MAKYIVEVVYEMVYEEYDGSEMRRISELESVSYEFEHESADTALESAKNHFENVRTVGLELYGGSIMRQLILPSAIKRVTIIDYEKWLEEMEDQIHGSDQSINTTVDESVD